MNDTNPAGDTKPTKEVRSLVGDIEFRAAAPAAAEGSPKGPGTIVGYAAVYNSMSEDLGYFREMLAPGCFADVLKTDDIRALANHDDDQLLGRVSSGTLRLAEDTRGLRVEIDLPDTQCGRDVAELVRRGDMSGMSFTFLADVDQWDMTGATPLRTVKRVSRVWDVGPVTFPAYLDTSAALRSLTTAKANPDPARVGPAHESPSLSPARARLRLAELL